MAAPNPAEQSRATLQTAPKTQQLHPMPQARPERGDPSARADSPGNAPALPSAAPAPLPPGAGSPAGLAWQSGSPPAWLTGRCAVVPPPHRVTQPHAAGTGPARARHHLCSLPGSALGRGSLPGTAQLPRRFSPRPSPGVSGVSFPATSSPSPRGTAAGGEPELLRTAAAPTESAPGEDALRGSSALTWDGNHRAFLHARLRHAA